jgi:hypothetical protein
MSVRTTPTGVAMAVCQSQLETYLGQSMADICPNHFSTPNQNHCAHFVSHAHDIQLGILCGDLAYETKNTGASIRCNELYNRLFLRGAWEERPYTKNGLLVFVTSARNVIGHFMTTAPQKHVGILCNRKVYNYSNSSQKVVADASVEDFHHRFKRAYRGNDISIFFGVVP